MIPNIGPLYFHSGEWDLYTRDYPFSLEPACKNPDLEVYKGAKVCRHDKLFDDQCNWECYHEECDYDFFGNDTTNFKYYEWDNHCGRPISNPSKKETLIQFEINNYNSTTPIPDMDKVEVCCVCVFFCVVCLA